MSNTGTISWRAIVFAVAFVGLLSAPLLTIPFYNSDFGSIEKRQVVEFPVIKKLSWSEYIAYPKNVEIWFDDHFGGRLEMIRSYRQLCFRLGLLNASSSGVSKGKNGWLYLSPGGEDDPLQIYSGFSLFSDEDLDGLQQYFEAWAVWLKERGIDFHVLIAPDKAAVYPEYLSEATQSSPYGTRTDHFVDQMKDTGVSIDYSKNFLVDQKKNSMPLYYKLDTHWNRKGAFLVYSNWMPKVRAGMSVSEADFRFVEYELSQGDLSALLGLQVNGGDIGYRITLIDGEWPRNFENWKSVPKSINRLETNYENAPRALVFHDSFMVPMADLVARHFSDSTFVLEPKIDQEMISESMPDIVILEFVERSLHTFLKLPLPVD